MIISFVVNINNSVTSDALVDHYEICYTEGIKMVNIDILQERNKTKYRGLWIRDEKASSWRLWVDINNIDYTYISINVADLIKEAISIYRDRQLDKALGIDPWAEMKKYLNSGHDH
jgi:hypothetical protein